MPNLSHTHELTVLHRRVHRHGEDLVAVHDDSPEIDVDRVDDVEFHSIA